MTYIAHSARSLTTVYIIWKLEPPPSINRKWSRMSAFCLLIKMIANFLMFCQLYYCLSDYYFLNLFPKFSKIRKFIFSKIFFSVPKTMWWYFTCCFLTNERKDKKALPNRAPDSRCFFARTKIFTKEKPCQKWNT